MVPRILLFTFALLAALFFPAAAFGQGETTIIAPEPPPPSTNWMLLVAAGTTYVLLGVTILRKSVPWFDGWKVPLLAVPLVAIAVSVYQVGIEDLKLVGKHAGILWFTAYGGATGFKKFRERFAAWFPLALKAYRAGESLPPLAPPSLDEPSAPLELAPKPTKPPPLPIVGGVVLVLALSLACLGCGSRMHALVTTADAAATAGEAARPVLREVCVEPMAKLVLVYEAAKAKDDKKTAELAQAEGKALANSCDPAIDAQAALLKLHAAMRAAILALHAGALPPNAQDLLLELVAAGAKLAKSLAALKGGAL